MPYSSPIWQCQCPHLSQESFLWPRAIASPYCQVRFHISSFNNSSTFQVPLHKHVCFQGCLHFKKPNLSTSSTLYNPCKRKTKGDCDCQGCFVSQKDRKKCNKIVHMSKIDNVHYHLPSLKKPCINIHTELLKWLLACIISSLG